VVGKNPGFDPCNRKASGIVIQSIFRERLGPADIFNAISAHFFIMYKLWQHFNR